MKMTQFAKFANDATKQILGTSGLIRENLQSMFSYPGAVNILEPVIVSGNIISIDDAAPLNAKRAIVYIKPVQSGTGDPSPDNIRPITGWDSVNVIRSGIDQSQSVTYNVTFPAEAGTIYKGILNVVEGTLTVTHKGGSFTDLYSSGLNAMSTNMSGVRRWGLPKSMFEGIANAISNNQPEDFLCSAYKTISAADTYSRNNGISVTESGLVVIFDENYSDSSTTSNSGAVAYFSEINPFFVWKLATPIIYQTTPTDILMLNGSNTIYADCGPMELEYYKKESGGNPYD